jgi:OHCU decarboxylase
MSEDEFVGTFAGLFQGPDWVVRRAYTQRPFSDTQDLRRAFQEALFAATVEEQEQLINSYPDLGAHVGGASLDDQSTLGLHRLAEKEHEELASLTQAYRDRFGFPLVTAVRDRTSFDQVLSGGWERLNNSPTQEHATALIEIAKIATHRFDEKVANANPIHSARTRHLES